MLVKVLKSKLHRARVTSTKLHYAGSIAIDPELMEAVGITPYESVVLADVTNGQRLETYAIPAEAGSGEVNILGAAAHLIEKDDIIIIFAFGFCGADEAKNHKPKVVALDESNAIIKRIS